MAKYALLVGVSRFENGFEALPSAENDVQRMKKLLEGELCNFEPITCLINPDRQELELAVYDLFVDKTPDDVVLFYFSGHGIKDEYGHLFFVIPETRKHESGTIIEPTATKATYLKTQMNSSRSKYQVIILDSCFSGAFVKGYTPKGDSGEINIAQSLGGRGRAILTSSSSFEYSFEDKRTGLSVYTRFFLEGIESGEADSDRDGRIAISELHNYIVGRLREAGSTMNPKLYPVEQGYDISIAKSPLATDIEPISQAQVGVILVGNVVNFSNYRGVDQRHIMQKLWEFIIEDALLDPRFSPETDGALDRFIIAWPTVNHQRVINFACLLTEQMKSQIPSTDLRIGLHQGWFESIERAGENDNHLIGVGPNECIRLARIADANNIILSEEFVRFWAQQQGPRIYGDLAPDDPNSPFEVFSKPSIPQRFFIYQRNKNYHRNGNVPRTLRILDIARQQLSDIWS